MGVTLMERPAALIAICPHADQSGLFRLETEMWLPEERAAVFPFFANAGNLEALTPDWLSFRILTPLPVVMQAGAAIDYRIRLHGVPIGWRTRIAAWDPPFRFVDEQLRGPYRLWRHEHTFEETRGGTLIRDQVDYAVWGGSVVHALFVRRDLMRIFSYRAERLRDLFGA